MALELRRSCPDVTLIAPYLSVQRLQLCMPFSLQGISLIDFQTYTSVSKFRQGLLASTEWIHRLPSLDKYDIVISDNLLEVLHLRPDAIISAQFFWHLAVVDVHSSYFDYCQELLEHLNPCIIGCHIFSMASVRSRPRFRPVGLFKIPGLQLALKKVSKTQMNSLLITGGSTRVLRDRLLQVIKRLIDLGPHPFSHVYVDPQLLPPNHPSWMSRADFSFHMYCHLKAAICRPGLGVLTDLLTVGARIYPIYEFGNNEMTHNASVVSRMMSADPDDLVLDEKISKILALPSPGSSDLCDPF